jgi:hypothetical protein
MMADKYGVNYTKQFVNIPSEKIPKGEQYGRVHVAYDEFTVTEAIATADNISMMKLPAGSRVIDAKITFSALSNSGVLLVGTAADPNAYLDAVAVNLVPPYQMDAEAGALVQNSAETQVLITATTATSATSGTIRLAIFYVVD